MTDITSSASPDTQPGAAVSARQKVIATLAAASAEAVAEKFSALPPQSYELVRQPETGLETNRQIKSRTRAFSNAFRRTAQPKRRAS